MIVPLDRDSGEPLYRQVRRALEAAVVQGRFGDLPLPSSRELARDLGVGRNTVALAYQELVAEGYVVAHPRSGMRVNPDLVPRPGRAPAPGHRPAWLRALDTRPAPDALPHLDKPADLAGHRYPFVTGQACLDAFPAAAWLRCLRTALEPPHRAASLREAHGADDPLLVRALCDEVLPARGITADPERVLVTNGSQQGLHLVATALVRPGDTVAVEDPGYPDARHILARAGARLAGLPVDRHGLDPEAWPRGAALGVVTPSHQYPTNTTLPAARRARLLELAAADGVPIVEDDYDSELRHSGPTTPAMAATAPGDVVYLGSFSKFLAPGLRLGYVVADPALIAVLRDLRRYMTRHPSGHQQRALALLIASGEYRKAVRRLRKLLGERSTTARQAVVEHLPDWTLEPGTAGVSLWLTAPRGLDTDDLAARAADAGILVETGRDLYLGDLADRPRDTLRLGFTAIPAADIRPGIAALAEVARRLRPSA
jgi:GntR family transcriptional regulator/MocR family aminotransferase